MNKFLPGVIAGLLTATPAYAETPSPEVEVKVDTSLEVMAGLEAAVLDHKVSFPLRPGLSFFNRNLFTGVYSADQDYLSSFHIASLNFNIVDGLDLVTEADLAMPSGEVDPRGGFQYFQQYGYFGMFNYATFSPKGVDVLFITELSYNPMFTKKVGLTANIEVLQDLGENFYNSTQRLRLGTNLGGYKFGPALDFNQATDHGSNETTSKYNAGVFLKKNF